MREYIYYMKNNKTIIITTLAITLTAICLYFAAGTNDLEIHINEQRFAMFCEGMLYDDTFSKNDCNFE